MVRSRAFACLHVDADKSINQSSGVNRFTDPFPANQPPQQTAVISETLRQELGAAALSEVFEFVDPTPLASASIAQVHIGRLKATGEEVAIKVLKPGVEDTLKADLGFLFLASRLVETLAPEARRASLGEIVGDIRTAIQDGGWVGSICIGIEAACPACPTPLTSTIIHTTQPQ